MRISSFFYTVKQGFKNIWNNRLFSLASGIGETVDFSIEVHLAFFQGEPAHMELLPLDHQKAVLGLEHHFSHIKREYIRYPRDGRASAPLHGQPVCSLHLDLFFFHKALSVYALDRIYETGGRNIHHAGMTHTSYGKAV